MLVFEEIGNPEYRRKMSRSKGENQQQTQPTNDAESGNRTRPHWWEASVLTTEPSQLPEGTFNCVNKLVLSSQDCCFEFQATKTVQRALSARQDLSFKGPRVQSKVNKSSAHAERSVVKFEGLTDKRTKDQKLLVHLAS